MHMLNPTVYLTKLSVVMAEDRYVERIVNRDEGNSRSDSNNRERTPVRSDDEEGLPPNVKRQLRREVGEALQKTIPLLLSHIDATVDAAVERAFERRSGKRPEREEELGNGGKEDSLVVLSKAKEKGKGKAYCDFKGFMVCKPKEYSGDIDPLASTRWIDATEASFETTNVNPEDKVIFAASLLTDRAKDWLKILRRERGDDGLGSMTWDEFKAVS